jgi:hypothetical protein
VISAARCRLPICQASASRCRASRPRTSIRASGIRADLDDAAIIKHQAITMSEQPGLGKIEKKCDGCAGFKPVGDQRMRRRCRAVSSSVMVATGLSNVLVTEVTVGRFMRFPIRKAVSQFQAPDDRSDPLRLPQQSGWKRNRRLTCAIHPRSPTAQPRQVARTGPPEHPAQAARRILCANSCLAKRCQSVSCTALRC